VQRRDLRQYGSFKAAVALVIRVQRLDDEYLCANLACMCSRAALCPIAPAHDSKEVTAVCLALTVRSKRTVSVRSDSERGKYALRIGGRRLQIGMVTIDGPTGRPIRCPILRSFGTTSVRALALIPAASSRLVIRDTHPRGSSLGLDLSR
jgi:hypothetical protein